MKIKYLSTMKWTLLMVLMTCTSISLFAQHLRVNTLRCDYRNNPAGVETSPRLSWQLQSDQRNTLQTAYRIVVADNPTTLANNEGNIWDSKKTSTDSSIQIAYKGPALQSAATYYWKVMVWDNHHNTSAWSAPAQWQTALTTTADWKGAQWIAYDALPDSNKIIPAVHGKGKKEWGAGKNILPLLRKQFIISKPVKKATIFLCGLGQFDLHVNGQKAGDHFLDPGWTQYDKKSLYVIFDITQQLHPGANALGVMLGNGFYYIPRERYRKLTGAFGYPKMIGRLLLEYKDGTTQDIVSDTSWTTAPGPVIFSSIYGGEDYDANLEQTGWDKPGFNDTHWKQALLVDGPPRLEAQTAEPLKIFDRFTPQKIIRLASGAMVYDLGQNASGIPQITVRGHKGDTIRIIPAELLNADSSVNQKASGSPSYFTYICKGTAPETWHPQFTYYGFRYLQVETVSSLGVGSSQSSSPGINSSLGVGSSQSSSLGVGFAYAPKIISVTGLHTRNAAPRAGSFHCSNELFNRTEKLIDWAIKSNMASVFTDCPHREKLGWLEEAHLVGSSVRYNYDIAPLCRKVIRDMMLAQTDSGLIPEIAPEFVRFEEPFRDSPEWGSNAIILPWYVYQWYGDKDLLTESYPMMQRYAAYLQGKAVNHILYQGLGDWYDLGPNHPGVSQLTPKGLTATAIWYYDLTILSQIARLLDKPADAEQYTQTAQQVKKAFNDTFFDKKTKQYGGGSQTANAMAVYMQLTNKSDRQFVIDNIVSGLRSRNNSLTAGDIGFRYLLRVLDDEGLSNVIYAMNNRSDVPGYGYQLAHGATALTESWAALPIVSNNHFMLGHILEWFYTGLAGIRPAPGAIAFHAIDIRPEPVGNITWANGSYLSPYGAITSSWKKQTSNFILNISIPANTTATVYLPATPASDITQNGQPVKALTENGKAIVRIGSGKYTFVVQTASPQTVTRAVSRLTSHASVPDSAMQRVYEEIKTPYKYGLVVVPADDTKKIDCPNVFRKGNQWYMTYLIYNGRGYETWLAQSNDLLHWDTKGRIMSFTDTTDWDNNQKAGYLALQDPQWGGSYQLQPYNNRYWLSYFGGHTRGYEAGDLSIGMAWTTSNPTQPHQWQRTAKPVLTAYDPSVSWWDNHKLYKSTVLWDKSRRTGYPFIMYYNANGDSLSKKRGAERIGMAVSNDMLHWQRYGKEPILDHNTGITGDPYLQKMGNTWVMFYFGAFWKDTKGAFNRFACSYDLVHWTEWKGDDLIKPSEPYDELFAHKSFVVKYKGVVYHFYCAVNKKDQRGIAVATSANLGQSPLHF